MENNMKDSGIEWIGEIPNEWKISKLKYHVYCLDGKRVPIDAALRETGPYPYWGAGNITDYVNDYIFDEELVLLGEDGAPFFDDFRPVSFLVNEKIWVNNHIHVLKGKNDLLNSFLVYFLNSVKYDVYINGSIIDKLTQGSMNTINITFPSMLEQRAITDFLDRKVGQIDDILADLNKQVETLNQYKKSLITETVTKGLNLDAEMKDSGIDWIGDIPKEWDVKKIRYLGYLQNGISKGSEYFGTGYPFLSYGNVYSNITLPEKVEGLVESTKTEQVYYSVKKDDAFFTRTSETIEEIGFTSVCEKTIPNATFAGFLIRFRPTTNLLNMSYAKYYFRAEMLRAYFVKEMMIVTRASLGQDLLKNLPVLLPSLIEQQKIADYLDKKCTQIDELITDKQKQIEKMKSYKKSLIYEYVTGKKRVRV